MLAVITGILILCILLLAVVIYSKSLKERTYLKELKNIKDFTCMLLHSSSEEEAYGFLAESVQKSTAADQTVVYFLSELSEENKDWKILPENSKPICSISITDCPLTEKLHECYVEDMENKAFRCPSHLSDYNTGSCICIPVINTDHSRSILQLYSKTNNFFNPLLLYKIKSYIEIAKPVISTKRALQLLNKKASTDKLTKVYNRSYLDPYLEKQIDVARLANQHLSLIMVDMDHFKAINDTFGHAAGDHVLELFAGLMLHCTRKTDLTARYGGDEFLIVLPATDTETAEVIAERILQTIGETRIPPFDGMIIPSVTCSIGISTFPVHCGSKESLMKTADIALYRAKHAGRNCISVYKDNLQTAVIL